MKVIDRLRIIKHFLFPLKYGFKGDFHSWENALDKSIGYDSSDIVEKVKNATLKVVNGDAIYERDSVLFNKIEYSWPLLASLLWIANQNENNLNVIDFGGSLGSTYFQNRQFLRTLNKCHWNIIEQDSFVKTGQQLFKNNNLQFFKSFQEAINKNGIPDVILLSCVLPYIKDPYKLIREIIGFGIKYIIIDNTFFNYLEKDRICIQRVSPNIYEASYPCWILSYSNVINLFNSKYKVIAEYDNELFMYLDGRKTRYKGFLAELNEGKIS